MVSRINAVTPIASNPDSPQIGPPEGGHHRLGGANGMGRTVTIGMAGEAVAKTRLLSWDVMWTVGGPI